MVTKNVYVKAGEASNIRVRAQVLRTLTLAPKKGDQRKSELKKKLD